MMIGEAVEGSGGGGVEVEEWRRTEVDEVEVDEVTGCRWRKVEVEVHWRQGEVRCDRWRSVDVEA